MSRGCTEQLVNHVLGARWDAFPDSARAATRTFILDSIGVGISGSRVATATMVKTAARGWGEGSDARIWNTGEAVPATTAALVNGFQIHNQEWDCVHERAVVHPMAVILAALIAFAERSGRRKQAIDGKTLMLATAIAVDVATTLGMCAVQPMRFFRPAMCGAFGAAAGIAVLRGSNAAELRNAFGLTLAQLSGTMQAHVEGTPALPFQIGVNARNAIVASDCANAGLRGPQQAIEGRFGYLALIEGRARTSDAFAELGCVWQIERVSHKPFPTGRAAHGALDMLAALAAEHAFAPEAIESIRLSAPPLVQRLVGRPWRADMDVAYARLCLPYLVATQLVSGMVTVDDFEPRSLTDPRREALAARVSWGPNACLDPNALVPQSLSVRLADGRVFATEREAVLGAPGNPLTRAQQLAKFRAACDAAAYPLDEPRCEQLIYAIDTLETLDDVRRLVDLTLGPEPQ
jgi:2-methylcitrate dehydratase PrpD